MRVFIKLLLLISVVSSPLSIAGSNKDAKAHFKPEAIVKFAKNVEKFAAENGARAFIIARVGRPQSDLPKGIKFTHTAVAIYSSITLANGEIAKGYAIHNLYQDANKPDRSSLIVDYPADFFWGAHDLKAGIIIPTPDLQQRIIETIASGKQQLIHNKKYSVLANPFNSEFQNCTEYTLDLLNASIYQTTDVKKLKLNAKAHFKPQRVKTSPFKLMLGSIFMDEVTTKDHKGKIYTTTFSTIGKYLKSNDLLLKSVVFDVDGRVSELI